MVKVATDSCFDIIPDDLQALARRLKDMVPPQCTHRSKVSLVVGAHVGPHLLAVAVLEAG
jgi:hypothetical protein